MGGRKRKEERVEENRPGYLGGGGGGGNGSNGGAGGESATWVEVSSYGGGIGGGMYRLVVCFASWAAMVMVLRWCSAPTSSQLIPSASAQSAL